MPEPLKPFPVQLRRIGIGEIAFKCQGFGEPSMPIAEKVDIRTSVGPYDVETGCIQVFVMALADTKESPLPYDLRVSVVGEFHVEDENKLGFPLEKLPLWAQRNGAAILLPFLRELVFSITKRTGFGPLMLPLVEVPVFRVNAPTLPERISGLPASAPAPV
jgi:preprotein translocase subunit SecB